MAKRKLKPKDLPKLIAKAESFGEFASMCFAGRVK
jgi:murein endopeptidase